MKKCLVLLLLARAVFAQNPGNLKPLINQKLAPGATDRVMMQNIKDVINAVADQVLILDQGKIPVLTLTKVRSLSSTLPKAIYIADRGRQGQFLLDSTDTVTPDNGGTVLRTRSNQCYKRIFSGGVDVGWFTIGDGLADDKAFLQVAIDFAASIGAYIYDTGHPKYRITGGIILKRGLSGIILNGILLPTGGNYTAVTTESGFRYKQFQIEINGSNNSINGLILDNPQISQFQAIRIHSCNGFGLKIIKSWDCVFENVSIELCGNTTNYAFSIEDGGDTSNMTTILRLQVEQSSEKAIYISPNTLSSVFNNIHSERQKVTGSRKNTWYLGGSSCSYNNLRIHAQNIGRYNDNFAQCHINGTNTSINDVRAEGNVRAIAESSSGGSIYLNAVLLPSFQRINSGSIYINGGEIALLMGNTNALYVSNVKSNTVNVGFSPDDANPLNYSGGSIGTLTSSDATARIKAVNTVILSGSFVQGATFLTGCTFTFGTLTASYRRVYLDNSKLIGNLTTDNGHFEFLNGSRIQGNFTIGAARSVIFDGSSYVIGKVSNMGPPQSSLYAGGFAVGQRIWNPSPGVDGQPEYWTCTSAGVSGTPGIWTKH